MPKLLPPPTGYKNYFLGKPPNCPAVLSSLVHRGKWLASFGEKGEILVENAGLRYFDTPQEALEALERLGAFR